VRSCGAAIIAATCELHTRFLCAARQTSARERVRTQPLQSDRASLGVAEAACEGILPAHMKRNEPITKIMTSDIETAHTGQKLSEVRRMLANNPYHHVPVVSGGKLIGMISASDMLTLSLAIYGVDERAVDAMLDAEHTIESVMTTKLTTISVKDTVRTAAELLGEGAYHSLPIVDDGKLVGLVTSTDVIRYLLAQY
jgi:CBS domain-containing protein